MNSHIIPIELVNAFREGRAAIFVGAGASVSAGLPTWQDLISAFARDLGVKPDVGTTFSPRQLANIPQYYENRSNRRRLLEKVRGLIESDNEVASEVHNLLAQLPCDLYYTTNYDELLEDALRRQGRRFNRVASEEAARVFADRRGCQVRKIHGTISAPDSLVVTRSDYARFTASSSYTLDILHNDLTQFVFLFVGYSLTDPDFNSIYDSAFYTMGRMRETHFMCVPSLSELEAQDLSVRGIEPIDLSRWHEHSIGEGLQLFLLSLAEATSEIVHIRRFFRGVDRGAELPIVVTSRLHEVEKYVYHPSCDLHVAKHVSLALSALGRSSSVIAAQRALDEIDRLLTDDMVLVCSPFGNVFTAEVLGRLADHRVPDVNFGIEEGGRRYLCVHGGDRLYADDPVRADGTVPMVDFAVIARIRSPWAAGKHIFLIAGVNAIGTHACGDFLADPMSYRKLPWREDDLVEVFKVSFVDHDPYNYRYELEQLSLGPQT